MRIQHNIPAMSAYRNYTNNVSSVSKNLEKLSSGYKINRAGDDAAGLAISEKMRAQISGLEQAQSNAKSGINLVQTAEGALTEVHDMLNRMYTLAEQSANGTYDNDVDRVQLQKEVSQLRSEINRIADSSNFNGIKLLDGSLNRVEATSSVVVDTAAMFGIGNETEDMAVYRTVGGYKPDGSAETAADTIKNVAEVHKDATEAGKTKFTIRYENLQYTATDDSDGAHFKFCLVHSGTNASGAAAQYSDGLDISIETDADGEALEAGAQITTKDIAKAIYDATGKDADGNAKADGAHTYTVKIMGDDDTTVLAEVEYNVTLNDDGSLTFEMSDTGYAAAKAVSSETNLAAFQGNFMAGLYLADNNGISTIDVPAKPEDETNLTDDFKATDFYKTYMEGKVPGATDGDPATDLDYDTALSNYKKARATGEGRRDVATSDINVGRPSAGPQLAETWVQWTGGPSVPVEDYSNPDAGANQGSDTIKDGAGMKIGDQYYVFAGTDKTLNADYGENAHVIDMRDLMSEDANGVVKLDLTKQNGMMRGVLTEALSRISDAAGDNSMWSVQVSMNGDMLGFTEKPTNTNTDILKTKDGIKSTIQYFEKSKPQVTSTHTTEATGKALTLQIGDTAESFNKLDVNIKDMHAAAMGIGDIDIGTQEGASAAMQKIKDAVNYVSDVRGDLGATQNRLDHTINNLSVMQENIQDAESTIRDVDVAKEMMAYTKNNILVQSAQAMLAQANQLPQGVLQLLG